jgi:hypothetical protein
MRGLILRPRRLHAKLFQRGALGYGQQVSAAELKQKLSLPQ